MFTLDLSIFVVVTQKDNEGNEQPISFMSASIQGPKLNYHAVDKQVYAVYKVVEYFRP